MLAYSLKEERLASVMFQHHSYRVCVASVRILAYRKALHETAKRDKLIQDMCDPLLSNIVSNSLGILEYLSTKLLTQ